eukprot:CAMPEP_0116561790 /NCGR_PEP_ID=MMETSP0397-20121206/11784_1 /TAXON_ID=216820 /ORGANISM="Cyclophora tenuis, Strain ECT3854" /LENGTH=337 /DNA_ID=CAMNT_0004087983 /DNA_START=268 /DNA_END=1281 /DNA_ORIENTATION=-
MRHLHGHTDDSASGLAGFIQERYGAFAAIVLVGVMLLVVVSCLIREFCQRRYGRNCCQSSLDVRRQQAREERERSREDERLAAELQQELQLVDKEKAIKSTRSERRRKYVEFLRPYTMVVKPNDLCRSVSRFAKSDIKVVTTDPDPLAFIDNESSSNQLSITDEEIGLSRCSEGEQEQEGFRLHDNTTGRRSPLYDAGRDEVQLCLPVLEDNGETKRVDASCSVCLLGYEPGDHVVFSSRKVCQHAFHRDCIMMWLEKGKKRCPICRNFFVPGSSIDDKKVIAHDEDDEFAIRSSDLLRSDDDERARSNTCATAPMKEDSFQNLPIAKSHSLDEEDV